MTERMRGRLRWLCRVAVALCVTPALAGVTVEIDKATLNEILGAVSVNEVEVEISAGNTIAIELRDLRVTGLLPATRPGEKHAIRTAVTVVAPDLGLTLPLQPRVALEVVQLADVSVLELRFEDLGLNVPLMGQINIASMVPPMRYPATNQWTLDGARGPVPMLSRLSSIEMDADRIRFRLELDVAETATDSRYTPGGGRP